MSVVVIMGTSGTGKTTVCSLLAQRLGVPHADADDFHPAANIAAMSAGTPLTDEDRWPWLDAVGAWARRRAAPGGRVGERGGERVGGVVSCSALKRSYRDRLRAAAGQELFFVHLTGDRALIERRMAQRRGHFMPAALLDSQFAALEPLRPDEAGIAIDVAATPEEITARALAALTR